VHITFSSRESGGQIIKIWHISIGIK